MKFIFLT